MYLDKLVSLGFELDAVQMVNWIDYIAEVILLADMGDEPSTAEELVEFYEDGDGVFPVNFNEDDRRLLVDRVRWAQRR